jgi:RNA polymerase sigma factor (sigma-70 family)
MGSSRQPVPDLVRVFGGETVSGLSEWQLLARYVERGDEVAFEAIVTRHAPVVLGVCRRMLGYSADVEDAFQATFLVLVRRARQLTPRDAIGPWLYGVAVRVAHRARSSAGRRRVESLEIEPAAADERTFEQRELARVLDEELARLPGKYRSPLVLCYLEGLTHEEAAARLGWPVGTVKGRLARARALLGAKLKRRGVAPTAGVLVTALERGAELTGDVGLVARTARTSLELASGSFAGRAVSSMIVSLAQGVLTAMFVEKIKIAAVAMLLVGATVSGVMVMARQGARKGGGDRQNDPRTVPAAASNSASETKVSRGVAGSFEGGAFPSDAEDEVPTDAKSRQILAKLEEPVSMPFANETPLDDVIKYIRTATTTKTFSGIPIYIDPQGLQVAEKTPTSPVRIDLEGVPLRVTLGLILAQLHLRYFVSEGILYITADSDETQDLPHGIAVRGASLLVKKLVKAERGELSLAEMKDLVEVMRSRSQLKAIAKEARATYDASKGYGGAGPLPKK